MFHHVTGWPQRSRRATRSLLTLAVCATILCGVSPEAAPAPAGDHSPSLILTQPDNIQSGETGVVIRAEVALRPRDPHQYLIAVPPDAEPTVRVLQAAIRDLPTGTIRQLKPGHPEDEPTLQEIARLMRLRPFGVLRDVRLMQLTVDSHRIVMIDRKQHEVASYEVAIDWPAFKEDRKAQPAVAEPLLEQLRRHLVVNAEDAARFASRPTYHGGGPSAPHPELPNAQWLQVAIDSDDIYSIDGKYLAAAGLDPATVQPGQVRLFESGVPVPTHVLGPTGASFAEGGRVLFWGRTHDSEETARRLYYVAIAEGDSASAMAAETAPDAEAQTVQGRVLRHLSLREENVFRAQIGAFLSIRNLGWVWGTLKADKPQVLTAPLPGFAPRSGDETTTLTVRLTPTEGLALPAPVLEVRLRAESIGSQSIPSQGGALTFAAPSRLLGERANELELVLQTGQLNENVKYLEMDVEALDFEYSGFLKAEDGRLEVADLASTGLAEGPAAVRLLGLAAEEAVALDLTDPAAPAVLALEREPETGATVLRTSIRPGRRIQARDLGTIQSPPPAQPSVYTAMKPEMFSGEVLLLYHPMFEEAARMLAVDIKAGGRKAILADVANVYANFSHGNLSSVAIRDFLAWVVYTGDHPRPEAVILFGDSSSDGRGIARNDVPNLMPIHLVQNRQGGVNSFASDSYYTWLNPGDEVADILLGRYSSSTAAEAVNAVTNTIEYRRLAASANPWPIPVLGIADTGTFDDSLRSVLQKALPPGMNRAELNADDYLWEDNYYLPPHLIRRAEDSKVSPLFTGAIEESINSGAAMTMFFGHGAPNLWSNQRFWFGGGSPNSDILRLANRGRLTFATSFTCNNAVVDYPLTPWNVCIAEDFMRHLGTGAVACYMPSGPGYLNNHETLAEGFLSAWGKAGVRSIGVLAEASRIHYQARTGFDDQSRMFLLLGDPTLELPPPAREGGREAKGGLVMIRELQPMPREDAGGTPSWSLILENSGDVAESATVEGLLFDADGKQLQRVSRQQPVPAFSREQMTVPFDSVAPGAYLARLQIANSPTGSNDLGYLPGTYIETHLVVPGGEGKAAILQRSVRLSAGSSTLKGPQVFLRVANTGTEERRLLIEVDTDPTSTTLASRQDLPLLPPGEVVTVVRPLSNAGFEFTEALPLVLRLYDAETNKLVQELHWPIEPAAIPNLAIVPDTLRIVPEAPSDGVTILVEAEVVNNGGATSDIVQMALYPATEEVNRAPLRNLTSGDMQQLRPMRPGERRRVQMRWDPAGGNAGEQRIRLVLDAQSAMAESDKSDNSASIGFRVRSKAKLVPRDLVASAGDERGELRLTARVENTGETDSQRVAVTFFRSQEQTPETKLGEVVVDTVPAGGTISAAFDWKVDVSREEFSAARPSFAVALKGSLMRTSSAAGPAHGEGGAATGSNP